MVIGRELMPKNPCRLLILKLVIDMRIQESDNCQRNLLLAGNTFKSSLKPIKNIIVIDETIINVDSQTALK